jgi:integrase
MIEPYTKKDGTIVWRARHGHGTQRSFPRKRDANEYIAEQVRNSARAKAGLETGREPITFTQLYRKWVEIADPSEWTLTMAKPALDKLGRLYLGEITTAHIGTWLVRLKQKDGKPYAEKTRRHMLAALRQVLNAGVDYGYITRSPASPRFRNSLSIPGDVRIRPIRPFETWDEVETVAQACAKRNPIAGPLVRFCCATGVRTPGEWINMLWNQIDGEILCILGTKTSASLRTLPLSHHALLALSELPQSLSGRVWIGKAGGRFDYGNWRDTDWRDALAECGLERRTPYEMRHTFATLALTAGASIADVASAMGHTDIQRCFQTYRKWTREMHERLRADLDQIGNPRPTSEPQVAASPVFMR